MKIKTLKLKNFRNYDNKIINFDEKVTVIVGPNGSGKTNILEAITMLSLGKSNKAIKTADIIKIGSNFAHITAILTDNDKLEVIIQRDENANRASKTYKINGAIKSRADFTGRLKSVYFGPEHIRLVAGSPSKRRNFLDQMLSQTHLEYRKALLLYNKVLKQRNKLLESIKGRALLQIHENQLDFWNSQLLHSGLTIQKYRKQFFKFSENQLQFISKDLFTNKLLLRLKYQPNIISEERFRAEREKEIAYGTTKTGPHLDDFEFVLVANNKNLSLKNYGSRGQQRTGVLCVKILELNYIKEQTGEKAVLLLDDIFSELDQTYRKSVENIIKDQQTIITTADESLVPQNILNIDNNTVFTIKLSV